jgi:hypothetical protein
LVSSSDDKTVRLWRAGWVIFRGRLANGTPGGIPLTQGTPLAGQKWWPVFLPLNQGREPMIGWIACPARIGDEFSVHSLYWLKPGVAVALGLAASQDP